METVYTIASEQQTSLEQQTQTPDNNNNPIIILISGIVILIIVWILRNRIASLVVGVLGCFNIRINTLSHSRNVEDNKMDKRNTIRLNADNSQVKGNELGESNQIIIDSDDSEQKSSEQEQ